MEEYLEVLNREKFAKFHNFINNAELVLNKIIEISIAYTKHKYKTIHSTRSFSPIILQKIVPYQLDMQRFFSSSWQKIKSHLWTVL
ncbi:MAG: hypothetical protein IPN93_11985 [Bacteroidetes bacterium]|nr:hypothetical protein [Bacteroidota bacterium]